MLEDVNKIEKKENTEENKIKIVSELWLIRDKKERRIHWKKK